MGANLVVAGFLGLLYLAYDVALTHGAQLPGGDLRTLFAALDVVLVVIVGTAITYLIVPRPRGSGTGTVRTAWSGALGFFASVPIAYLVLVIVIQVLRPLLT